MVSTRSCWFSLEGNVTIQCEGVERTPGKAIFSFVLALGLGYPLSQSNGIAWASLLISIYDDIGHHGQFAGLNLEVANGKAVLWVTLSERILVRTL